MGRSKLLKFQDNFRNDNVIQAGKEIFNSIQGKWREVQFRNDNPVILELACGRGEYTVGLARYNPDKNFIGIDIKGARIWTGSQIAIEEKLSNVAFLRTHIQNLGDFFNNNEIDEIWIIHPDPRPKKSDEHRRLTHPRFLDIYRRLIKPGGLVRLKTDDTGLFEYSLEVIKKYNHAFDLVYTYDLHASEYISEHLGIETRYEKMSVQEGITIKYLKFKLN